jgi:hypothetical protein
MPVSFLTEKERERLQSLPSDIPESDIIAFFTLSPAEIKLVKKQRGEHNKLGYGLQLCLLRYLGFSPDDLTPLPEPVTFYVSQQLNVARVSLELYGNRIPTRTEHLQEIQAYLGFHTATQQEFDQFSHWLRNRALEHDKPSLLLRLLCEKLYREKIIRPGISRLERLIATARSQAQSETYKRLAPLLGLPVVIEQKTTNFGPILIS